MYEHNTENDPFTTYSIDTETCQMTNQFYEELYNIFCEDDDDDLTFEINYPISAAHELDPNFAADLMAEILTDGIMDGTISFTKCDNEQSLLAKVRKVDFKSKTQWID